MLPSSYGIVKLCNIIFRQDSYFKREGYLPTANKVVVCKGRVAALAQQSPHLQQHHSYCELFQLLVRFEHQQKVVL